MVSNNPTLSSISDNLTRAGETFGAWTNPSLGVESKDAWCDQEEGPKQPWYREIRSKIGESLRNRTNQSSDENEVDDEHEGDEELQGEPQHCQQEASKCADELEQQQVREKEFGRRRIIQTTIHRLLMVTLSVIIATATTAESFVEVRSHGQFCARQAFPSVAMQNVFVAYRLTSKLYGSDNDHQYDSDSYQIAIDNCSSWCITNDIRDFVNEPRKVSVRVTGVAGSAVAMYVGTVKWSVEDDKGRVHHWIIPNTFYNAQSPYRLLSPQHWAQERQEQRGTGCVTYFDAVELFWSHAKFEKIVELDPAMNVALIRSAPGFAHFNSFCATVQAMDSPMDEMEFLCVPCTAPGLVSDDDTSDSEDSGISVATRRHPDLPDKVFIQPTANHRRAMTESNTLDFDLQPDRAVHVVTEDVDVQGLTPQAELLVFCSGEH